MVTTGRAWIFGDGISTDHIAPGRFYHLRSNLPEMAKYVLVDAREDFASKVQPGDVVVAGANFGLGSSREHAPRIMKIAGIGVVLARSFARIFYRNAINVGLPAIVCDTRQIQEGDILGVDLGAGKVTDVTRGFALEFPPLPAVMTAILQDGGLVEHIRKHGGFAL